MNLNFAGRSLLLFGVSVVLLVAFTVFESALAGLTLEAQRLFTLLGLILPALIGAVLGVLSLVRREGWVGMAIASAVLNTLFALFHLMIVLFAG